MELKRKEIDRWVAIQQDKEMKRYPNNQNIAYASLCGKLQAVLGDIAVGGISREIAIEIIQEDLETNG